MFFPMGCVPPCVLVTSQRTLLQTHTWKLRIETAEPKPLRYSSSNTEGMASPEGKN